MNTIISWPIGFILLLYLFIFFKQKHVGNDNLNIKGKNTDLISF